jgi:hypothetical protein
MRMIKSFDPSEAQNGTIDPQVSNPCGRLYLFNESIYGLQLTFQDGSSASLPPFYFRSYVIRKPGPVQWKQLYALQSSGAPVSQVFGESYESSEAKSISFVEGPLNRLNNVGNTVSTNVGSSTTLQNDNNPSGQTFIESTPAGAGLSTVSVDNAGNVTIRGNNAGVLTQLLKIIAGASPEVIIAAAGVLTAIIGSLSADNGAILTDGNGNITKLNSLSFDGAESIASDASHDINFFINSISTSNPLLQINAGGLDVTKAGLLGVTANEFKLSGAGALFQFLNPSGTLSRVSFFTGTGSGTFSHGLGATPTAVFINYSGNFGTAPTQDPAWFNANASTVQIAAQSGYFWQAMAVHS